MRPQKNSHLILFAYFCCCALFLIVTNRSYLYYIHWKITLLFLYLNIIFGVTRNLFLIDEALYFITMRKFNKLLSSLIDIPDFAHLTYALSGVYKTKLCNISAPTLKKKCLFSKFPRNWRSIALFTADKHKYVICKFYIASF